MTTADALQACRLTKSYGGTTVLHGVTFTVRPGEVTGFLGPNGSGKTTTLKLILGLLRPATGRVQGTAGKTTAVVFQEDRLLDHLDATANVRAVQRGPVTNAAIAAEFDALGLAADQRAKPVAELSGGQRRRVALARALVAAADVTGLDEPFTGLDQDSLAPIAAHVRARLTGRQTVLITHDPAEAAGFGGRTMTLGPAPAG